MPGTSSPGLLTAKPPLYQPGHPTTRVRLPTCCCSSTESSTSDAPPFAVPLLKSPPVLRECLPGDGEDVVRALVFVPVGPGGAREEDGVLRRACKLFGVAAVAPRAGRVPHRHEKQVGLLGVGGDVRAALQRSQEGSLRRTKQAQGSGRTYEDWRDECREGS